MDFNSLDEDVLIEILSFLDLTNTLQIGQTCKSINHVSKSNCLWTNTYLSQWMYHEVPRPQPTLNLNPDVSITSLHGHGSVLQMIKTRCENDSKIKRMFTFTPSASASPTTQTNELDTSDTKQPPPNDDAKTESKRTEQEEREEEFVTWVLATQRFNALDGLFKQLHGSTPLDHIRSRQLIQRLLTHIARSKPLISSSCSSSSSSSSCSSVSCSSSSSSSQSFQVVYEGTFTQHFGATTAPLQWSFSCALSLSLSLCLFLLCVRMAMDVFLSMRPFSLSLSLSLSLCFE